jgi:hypothetical protein
MTAKKVLSLDGAREVIFRVLERKGREGATPRELGSALAKWLERENIKVRGAIESIAQAMISDPVFKKRARFDGQRTYLLEP